MKLRHRFAAIAAIGLLITCLVTVAVNTHGAPASLATDGTIIVEN